MCISAFYKQFYICFLLADALLLLWKKQERSGNRDVPGHCAPVKAQAAGQPGLAAPASDWTENKRML